LQPSYPTHFGVGGGNQLGTDHPDTLQSMMHLYDIYSKCDRFADADEILRKCLEIRDRKEPDLWSTFNTMSLLSGAWLVQKQYAESETLRLRGAETARNNDSAVR
jgi:eukaryotic-like serine/threonine-protein kinase